MSKYDKIDYMFNELRQRFPNFVIITATQIPRYNVGFIPERIKVETPNIIIIDHFNLIKTNNL